MQIHLTKNSSKSGFSMVELLFVIVVLGVTLTSILFLHTQIVKGRSTIYQQTQATNYARQGIEMVRNIRDNNWRNGRGGFDGMLSQGTNIYALEYAQDRWELVPVQDDMGVGVYTHAKESVDSDIARRITIQPICLSAIDQQERIEESGAICLATEELIGVFLNVVVEYRQVNVATAARLYNWR